MLTDWKTKAVTAAARKVAAWYDRVLRYGAEYIDPGEDYYEERHRRGVLKNLEKKAKRFDLARVPLKILPAEVSQEELSM